jgi:zinc protease
MSMHEIPVRRLAVLAGLLLLSACAAGPAARIDTVHETTLANGLRVIVKEDRRAPVVVSEVWYRIGSIDEPEGLTGISHVLEHMMFKGTQRLKPNEFSRIIAANGGTENAFTSHNYTGYFQMLERSRLPVAFELEAERMQNLRLDPAEYAKEIKVVMEERRLRIEDRPERQVDERFMATAYRVSPYRHPVIGWMRDLERMKVEDLRVWYDRYYSPSNAVLIVVGDVDAQEVFALAQRHFGPIPARAVNHAALPPEPEQSETRRLRLKLPAEVPYLVMGFHAPTHTVHREPWEPYALYVLAGILDGGNSARFPRELVRGQRIAASASVGYYPVARGTTLFMAEGHPAEGRSVEQLEAAILEQIGRLQREPVSAGELARVKAQVTAADVYARDSIYMQARKLGSYATIGLDWRQAERFVEHIRAVTPEQIRMVARRYLNTGNLTVAVLDPLPIDPRKPPRRRAPEVRHGQ